MSRYYNLNIVSTHRERVCVVYVSVTECLLESLTGRLLFEVLRLGQRLQRETSGRYRENSLHHFQ